MPVVDASVVVDLIAPDRDPQSRVVELAARWARDGVDLVGPRLLQEEVLNALLTGIRRRRWDGAAADGAAVLLDRLPIVLGDVHLDRDRAWELARRYDDWPIYDMVYVALAERLGEQLVTADDRLRRRLAHLGWVVAPADA
ncbi:MAG: type II toxin-antitoxin system VapC family toxin [Actinomycetota bacterium]|nr:type II toxin-antitoxin system VapC family toxin [Actinomycetota bacterium]